MSEEKNIGSGPSTLTIVSKESPKHIELEEEEFNLLKQNKPDYKIPELDESRFLMSLPEDPVIVGIFSINENLSKVQDKKNELVSFVNKYESAKTLYKSYLAEIDRFIEKKKANVLINDPEVKTLSNASKQNSYVELQVSKYLDFRSSVESTLSVCTSMCNIAKNLMTNLESANENISRSVSVVGHQIAIQEICIREFPHNKYWKGGVPVSNKQQMG